MYYRKALKSSLAALLLVGWITVSLADANDTLFADHQPLAIDKLIKLVLSRNPTLQAQQAAWEADRARIKQARALPDPMLRYTVAPDTRKVAGRDVGEKWQISQRLPWPGKRRFRGQAARHDATASSELVASVRLRLTAATKKAFADWYYVHKAMRINQTSIVLWKGFRKIAELKYATGITSKQDALRAEVEGYKLDHRAITLERQRRSVLARINALLLRNPDARLPLPGMLAKPMPLRPVQELRNTALAQHPGLRATTARIDAAKARVRLARRNNFPDFTLSVGRNTLWDREEKRNTVGIGLNIPLYFGKRRAATLQARAQLKQAEWRQRDKAIRVQQAVQQTYDRVQESRHVLKLYREKLLPAAEDNLSAARSDYRSGTGSFLTLVTTEKNLIETQLRTSQALADYHRYLAELIQLVGGSVHLAAESATRGKKP